jgi:tetratricopeptide (TPR) repeat protein
VRFRLFLFFGLLWSVSLTGQENADSLYRSIITKRERGDLSIILVDKALAFEGQKNPVDPGRMAELFLYRGELLQQEKRNDEAISAFTSCLGRSSRKWISDEAHFKRALVYDAMGSLKARRNAEERMAASHLYWFGKNDGLESSPSEFVRAEEDYRAVDSLDAGERLVRLYLVTGNVPEAASAFRGLSDDRSPSDGSAAVRLKAYEILLCEATEDFAAAERLYAGLSPENRKLADPLLEEIRSNRLEKTIRFNWVDRTAHESGIALSAIDASLESRPIPAMDLRWTTKRLLFEGNGGGFLVSGKAAASGIANDGRNCAGVGMDVLGTILSGDWSVPGGGGRFDYESSAGSGRRILKADGGFVSRNSGSRFGFNLNGGYRQMLFAFFEYGQSGAWLNGVSERLSVSGRMLKTLGIGSAGTIRTHGVYGLGSAGTGWWPGKTHDAVTDLTFGVNTRLSRNFTLGAAYSRLTSEVADHDELTVDGMNATYAHRIFVSERIHLVRLDAAFQFGALGLRFRLGAAHSFECASRMLYNNRVAQVVKSVPDAGGIHVLLLSDPGGPLNGDETAFVRTVTGYVPEATRAVFSVIASNFVFSAESTVNGLRSPNREIRFRLGVQSAGRILSQCLHDLAPWRP